MKGKCPVCGKWFAVRVDATIRGHNEPGRTRSNDYWCLGSGEPPAEVDATFGAAPCSA